MRHNARGIVLLTVCLLLLPQIALAQSATPIASPAAEKPSQPTQPTAGPGSSDYSFAAVTANHYGPASDGSVPATGYWIFEPADPGDAQPATGFPLVMFFHGFFGTDPVHYREWIDHIVRRGAIVIYPDYQPNGKALEDMCSVDCSEPAMRSLPNAIEAIKAALVELGSGSHDKVDLTKAAATGHSWGGMLTAQYAAQASALGLPVPLAIMPAMPGCGCEDFSSGMDKIPAGTLVTVLIAQRDTDVAAFGSDIIFSGMTSVPPEHRDLVEFLQDAHGTPTLRADHPLPTTDGNWGPLDAFDWYGTWKLFDMLTDCAWNNTGCDTAMNNSPEERSLGQWSDGTPVKELVITDGPGT